MRTFVAVAIPGEVRSRITTVTGELADLGIDARISRSEAIHLTLRFLGEIDEAQVSAVRSALGDLGGSYGGFSVTVSGLGAFPYLSNPRVVWTNAQDDSGGLSRLQQDVEEAMGRLGFPREDRPFRPHLTLARIKSRRNVVSLIRFIEERGPTLDLGGFEVEQYHLFQSVLRPEGAQYRILESFNL